MPCGVVGPGGEICTEEGNHADHAAINSATLCWVYWENTSVQPTAPQASKANHLSRGLGRGFKKYPPTHSPSDYVEAVGATIESANVIHFRKTDVVEQARGPLAELIHALANQITARGDSIILDNELSATFDAVMANTPPARIHRESGPATSAKGARSVSLRSGTQKMKLLEAFADASDGLTDEEAARIAGLLELRNACWWHRASDLRADELIQATGVERKSPTTNEMRMVSVITARGLSIVQRERKG